MDPALEDDASGEAHLRLAEPAPLPPGPPPLSGRPLAELAREITYGAVRLAAATAAWLRLVAEFDEHGGWYGVGIKSCAHWPAWQCGLGPGAAREHVHVARALRRLPLIDRAFAEGRLSFAKVRALTRIAEADCEADLLEVALELTASQLERVVRQWRRAERPDEELLKAKEQFETWWDDDGMLVLRVRMRPEHGAPLLTSVDSLADRFARRERAARERAEQELASAGRNAAGDADTSCVEDDEVRLARERTTARRIAALVRLAEAAADADRRAGDPPRREVVLHFDAAVLDDDAAAGRAYLEGGPALHPSQARRMLCEATVVTMLEKDREVLAVGRAKRRATRAQRRALLRRDGGCARPGCPENRIERLHAHHMRHWLYGGRTDLADLVLLCDADHGLVHDLDLVMSRRGREPIVTTGDGRRVSGRADRAFDEGLAGLELADRSPAAMPTTTEPFVGVEPIDQARGRRPALRAQMGRRSSPNPQARKPRRPAGQPTQGVRPAAFRGRGRRAITGGRAVRRLAAARPSISGTLFPAGEPPLPQAIKVNGERMDTAYVVGVLMGNRDLVRRLAAESGADVSG